MYVSGIWMLFCVADKTTTVLGFYLEIVPSLPDNRLSFAKHARKHCLTKHDFVLYMTKCLHAKLNLARKIKTTDFLQKEHSRHYKESALLPASMCCQASGNRCRKTSPNRPPTAKLNSSFSLWAAAARKISRNKFYEVRYFISYQHESNARKGGVGHDVVQQKTCWAREKMRVYSFSSTVLFFLSHCRWSHHTSVRSGEVHSHWLPDKGAYWPVSALDWAHWSYSPTSDPRNCSKFVQPTWVVCSPLSNVVRWPPPRTWHGLWGGGPLTLWFHSVFVSIQIREAYNQPADTGHLRESRFFFEREGRFTTVTPTMTIERFSFTRTQDCNVIFRWCFFCIFTSK